MKMLALAPLTTICAADAALVPRLNV